MQGPLNLLLLCSGTYEMIILTMAFHEFLTWRISLTWFALVSCLAIGGQFGINAELIRPTILGYFLALIILNTIMASRLIKVNWVLMLPIVTFLNALKYLITGFTSQLNQWLLKTDWQNPLISLNSWPIFYINFALISGILLGFFIICTLGWLAHYLIIRSNTVTIFYRAALNRHDNALVLITCSGYVIAKIYVLKLGLMAQIYTAALTSIILGGLIFYLVNKNNVWLNDVRLLSDVAHYNEVLSDHNQQLHLFKHDYQNILLSMSQYIAQEDMSGLKRYFEQEVFPNEQLLNQTIAPDQLRYLRAPALSGLIYAKYQTAEHRHVKLEINIWQTLTLPQTDQIKVVRVLGNLLDNAIDAATQADQLVQLTITQARDNVIVTIANQLPNHTTIDLKQISRQHFTTKLGHTGNGLSSIARLVNKQLTVHYQVIGNTFQAQLRLKKSNN